MGVAIFLKTVSFASGGTVSARLSLVKFVRSRSMRVVAWSDIECLTLSESDR